MFFTKFTSMNSRNLLNTNINYYAFGSLIPGRSFSSSDYRYGFNGKEKDAEIKGEGNSYDFGSRIYDPRIGRWLSIDPLFKKGSQYSPYNFTFNNPILFIDNDGNWPLYTHYRMTFKALISNGVNKDVARKIAHYSSVYADNPSPDKNNPTTGKNGGVIKFNQAVGMLMGIPKSELAYKADVDYSKTVESQTPSEVVEGQDIHATQMPSENSPQAAIDRTLEKAISTFEKYEGKDLENLGDEDYKEIGLAYHRVQDTKAHEGAKWDGRAIADQFKKGFHKITKDMFGSRKESRQNTSDVTKMYFPKKTKK